MKIFIAGKFNDLAANKKFGLKAHELTKLGFEVINPHDELLTLERNWPVITSACISLMITGKCNSIFLFDDWKECSTAKLLFYMAMSFNYDTFFERDMDFLKRMSTIGAVPAMGVSPNIKNIEKWANDKIDYCHNKIAYAIAHNELEWSDHLRSELQYYKLIIVILNNQSK